MPYHGLAPQKRNLGPQRSRGQTHQNEQSLNGHYEQKPGVLITQPLAANSMEIKILIATHYQHLIVEKNKAHVQNCRSYLIRYQLYHR